MLIVDIKPKENFGAFGVVEKFLFIIPEMSSRVWRITTGLINQIGRLMDFPVKKHFHNFFPHRVQPLKVSRNKYIEPSIFFWGTY